MNAISNLVSLGFSEYEAKVYLSLLEHNPVTGYQVSKRSGVPRSMVYEALGRLNKRGAVLKSDAGKTSLYRPVPPEVLLNRIDQEHNQIVHDLRENMQRLYQIQDEDLIWSIHGRGSVIAYAEQMIGQAQEEVSLTLTDPDVRALENELSASCKRGIRINALLTGTAKLDPRKFDGKGILEAAYHPPVESELQELSGLMIITVDSSECLIANTDQEAGNLSAENGVTVSATVTNNRNLVFIARQFIWMELFTQRIRERLGTDLLERLDPQDRRIFDMLPTNGDQAEGNQSS